MTSAQQRWDQRYRSGDDELPQPSPFLLDHLHLVDDLTDGVDIGAGKGANALALIRAGLAMTLIDVSGEGLTIARGHIEAAGSEAEYVQRDVEVDGLPAGRRWDLALMHLFFDEAVVRAAASAVRPGGLLLVCQPTLRNRERHPRPSPRFLLEPGRVAELAAQLDGFEVIDASEGWRRSTRHDAWLVARKRGPT